MLSSGLQGEVEADLRLRVDPVGDLPLRDHVAVARRGHMEVNVAREAGVTAGTIDCRR